MDARVQWDDLGQDRPDSGHLYDELLATGAHLTLWAYTGLREADPALTADLAGALERRFSPQQRARIAISVGLWGPGRTRSRQPRWNTTVDGVGSRVPVDGRGSALALRQQSGADSGGVDLRRHLRQFALPKHSGTRIWGARSPCTPAIPTPTTGSAHWPKVSVVLAAIYELRKSWLFGRRATPIHRHSLLGNGQSTALVDPGGRICWMPHPLPHSSSMFSEILGAEAAGFFAVETEAGTAPLTQRYITTRRCWRPGGRGSAASTTSSGR